MSTHAEARRAYARFKDEFEAEKRAEFKVKSQALRDAISKKVHMMHSQGISVSEIARQYGTSNRNTIYDILKGSK